jgi:hypothetical protein
VRALEQLLDDQQADDNERMGVIIVISDRVNISIHKRTLRSNYTVHAFGFRGVDNARAMHRIASSSSSGIYGLLHDGGDEITEAFKCCISKVTSFVAVKTRVNISCRHSSSSVKMSGVESGRFKSSIDRRRKCVHLCQCHLPRRVKEIPHLLGQCPGRWLLQFVLDSES